MSKAKTLRDTLVNVKLGSDARTGSIIDDRVRPALESGYAVGSTKPVLLIIDEIDGATGAGDNVRNDTLFLHFNFLRLQQEQHLRPQTHPIDI